MSNDTQNLMPKCAHTHKNNDEMIENSKRKKTIQ